MPLNPLNFPKKGEVKLTMTRKWASLGDGDEDVPPPPPKKERSRRLSKQEELALAVEGVENIITIEVHGISKVRAGSYKLPYERDTMLRHYLQRSGLMFVGVKHAMYDTTNYEKGRLRTSYIPAPSAVIMIGPANYSPILRERQQRKVDAFRVQAEMTKTEGTMRYGEPEPAPKPVEQVRPSSDGVDQW